MARKNNQPVSNPGNLPSTKIASSVKKSQRNKAKYGSEKQRKKELLTKRKNIVNARVANKEANVLRRSEVVKQRAVAAGRIALNQPIRTTASVLTTGGKGVEAKIRSKVKYQRKGPTTTRLQKAEKYLEKRGTRAANMPMKGTTKTNLLIKKGVSKVYDKLGRVSQVTGRRSIKKRYKVLGAIGAVAAYRSIKNKNKEQGK